MSENKISQLPWTVDGCQIHAQGVYLLALQSGAPISENKENAKAIVSAMNNTYGSGVNPIAVPDLLKAAIWALNALEFVGEPDASKALEAAIDKAKLI